MYSILYDISKYSTNMYCAVGEDKRTPLQNSTPRDETVKKEERRDLHGCVHDAYVHTSLLYANKTQATESDSTASVVAVLRNGPRTCLVIILSQRTSS